jgi:hypothetical protein
MIVAAMATMPNRLPYLEEVVETIRPQVDVLRVYLNGFIEPPEFLKAEEACLSNDADGDLGDAGKFYWLDDEELRDYTHYLTLDDDIGYPKDYVSKLKAEFDIRQGGAIVGVHGSEFSQPIVSFVESRQNRCRFYEGLEIPRSVHILGTATTMWGKDTIQLTKEDFPLRNMGDLQLAIAAQKQNVPMVAIPRPEGWVTERRPWTDEGFSIWKQTKLDGHSKVQTHLAQTAVNKWILRPDPL